MRALKQLTLTIRRVSMPYVLFGIGLLIGAYVGATKSETVQNAFAKAKEYAGKAKEKFTNTSA
jgi:hypothetical protein